MVTAVGLGSLMTQANQIREQMDPFRTSRTQECLGPWFHCQPRSSWNALAKPIPRGPVIRARLDEGLGGQNQIAISRLPMGITGTASWTICLSVFHKSSLHQSRFRRRETSKPNNKNLVLEKESISFYITMEDPTGSCESEVTPETCWLSLHTQPLTRQGSSTALIIDRTTLMVLFSLVNSRELFRYNDASGHRAAYTSYCGNWYIEWPLGAPCTVRFAPHESHRVATDVYPRLFHRRVDKCIQMMAGVISTEGDPPFRCAFTGRKPGGSWILEHQRRGFPGAHGSRHLYHLVGGNVYETDYLYARCLDDQVPQGCLQLILPGKKKDAKVTMYVPPREQEILAQALDSIPWDNVSWSIHWGLRDLLAAFAKPTMDRFRSCLAAQLKRIVNDHKDRLQACGWTRSFIDTSMGDFAASAVLAGEGESGDAVRVVAAIAALPWSDDSADMDETMFWRAERHHPVPENGELSPTAVIALTKCFMLEWSMAFDYRFYDFLPSKIAFV